jgi:hypothetical protein
MRSYPKIFNLGHKAIEELFFDDVQVEEKVDGSQFSFGVYKGELLCRSKSVLFEGDYYNDMFEKAVETAKELKPLLNDGWTYRAEFLKENKFGKAKHNALQYERVPKKNLIIFDIDNSFESYIDYESKQKECERLGLECVPLLYHGKIDSPEFFKKLLETKSILGGVTIEGVVIKNYKRFGVDKKVLMGKYVSEQFKEINKREWRKPNKKEIFEEIGMSFNTEARWNKSIQHLRDQGLLEDSPRDIGSLLKEINKDILAECENDIKEQLFKWAWGKIGRYATKGFPQWYKEKLVEKQFGEKFGGEK